ncbi:unnamed protein product [Somion occarium]|uniref:Glutaredoxin-like protein n=1 Tax=Somion occarium TaxID=3059160 RepID=A0ABP1DG15_9APHY
MAHRRTYSARHLNMGHPGDSPLSPPLTPPLAALNSFQYSVRKPRQFWQRITFLALFALVVVSGYVLLIAQPSLSPIPFGETDHARSALGSQRLSRLSQQASRLAALRHKSPFGGTAKTAVRLNREQELAAVSAFLASLPQNVIPSSVDPSKPIDPQLVLDFDTQSPHALEEIDALVNETWARNPVFLYAKTHSPLSRELKQMLEDMNLLPSPTIIDVDQRPDESVLTPLLHRLTSTSDLPILLIGGHTIGSIPEIRYLYAKGELSRMINRAGGIVDGAKKKKGRKH